MKPRLDESYFKALDEKTKELLESWPNTPLEVFLTAYNYVQATIYLESRWPKVGSITYKKLKEELKVAAEYAKNNLLAQIAEHDAVREKIDAWDKLVQQGGGPRRLGKVRKKRAHQQGWA